MTTKQRKVKAKEDEMCAIVDGFAVASAGPLHGALEAAYDLGFHHRALSLREAEQEALLLVLKYARRVTGREEPEWDAAFLTAAIEAYDKIAGRSR